MTAAITVTNSDGRSDVANPVSHRRDLLAMLLAVVALHAIGMLIGERVPEGGGLGWDGVIYGKLVRDLPELWNADQISAYYAHRLAPMAAVRLALEIVEAPLTNANIIAAFQLLNLFAALVTAAAWHRLAEHFQMTGQQRWLGFAGIFLSFEGSKLFYFMPVLVDPSVIAVSMVMLVFFIEKRTFGLFVWIVFASFVWSTAAVIGALLLAFPRAPFAVGAWQPTRASVATLAFVVVASLVAFAFLSGERGCAVPRSAASALVPWMRSDACGHVRALVTTLPSLALLTGAGFMLTGLDWRAYVKAIRAKSVVLAVSALAVTVLLNVLVSNPDVPGGTSSTYLAQLMLLPPAGKVFLPLVSLAVFWGPLAILAFVNWRQVCAAARSLGVGMVAVVGMVLPLMLTTEPRFITFSWPFVLLCTVLALPRLTVPVVAALAAIIVAFSKIWLPMDVTQWSGAAFEGLQELPKQRLFLNLGLWMNMTFYVLQAIAVAIVAAWLRLQVRPQSVDCLGSDPIKASA